MGATRAPEGASEEPAEGLIMSIERTTRRLVARFLFLTFVMVMAGLFLVTNAAMVGTAMAGLGDASLAPVFVGVLLSFVAMANRGLLNRAAHRAVGLEADAASLTRTSTVGYAASKVVKSGGASGLAVFVRHGRRRGHPGCTVTASCVIVSALTFAALGVLMAANITVLGIHGRLSGWWLAAGAGFAAYSVGVLFLCRTAMRRSRAQALWARSRAILSRVRRRPLDPEGSGLDAVYDALAVARHNRRWLGRALGHALLSKGLGLAMLLAAALAGGLPLSITDALLVYTTALTASFLSIVPSGIGVVEATTGAMLVGAGAPVAMAIVIVALFRIFDLWLPVATGAILGRHDLKPPAARSDPAVEPGLSHDGEPSAVEPGPALVDGPRRVLSTT